MKTFKTGVPVRLIAPVVEGVVVGGQLGEGGDSIDYRVVITLPNGEHHVRLFASDELAALEGDDAARVLAKHEEHVQAQRENVLADAQASLKHLIEQKAPDEQIEAARERLAKAKGGVA